MGVVIKQGGEGEIHDLMALIKDLALFEKAPEEVITDADELLADLKAKRFEYLVLEHEQDGIIGISLYYPRYSTWKGFCYYLEDLYVKPNYRGHGYGKLLLKATADKAREAGAKRMDWQVLDWNESAVKFYEKLGANIEKEWWNCKWWLNPNS